MATFINGVLVPEGLTDREFNYWYEAQEAKRQLKEAILYWKRAAFFSASFCSIAATLITRILYG